MCVIKIKGGGWGRGSADFAAKRIVLFIGGSEGGIFHFRVKCCGTIECSGAQNLRSGKTASHVRRHCMEMGHGTSPISQK